MDNRRDGSPRGTKEINWIKEAAKKEKQMSNGTKKKAPAKNPLGSASNPRKMGYRDNVDDMEVGYHEGWIVEECGKPKSKNAKERWSDIGEGHMTKKQAEKMVKEYRESEIREHNIRLQFEWRRANPVALQEKQHVQFTVTKSTTKAQIAAYAEELTAMAKEFRENKRTAPKEPVFDEVPEYPKFRAVKVTVTIKREAH